MTNEERGALIAQGWAPPKVIDPDEQLARSYARHLFDFQHPLNIARAYSYFLSAIKQGRALAAEAKPGLVWVKNSGLSTPDGAPILTRHEDGNFDIMCGSKFSGFGEEITHYAVITPPEDVA